MFVFYIWCNLAFPTDEGRVVSSLVKRGYNVSAAADNGQLSLPANNKVSALLALKLERDLLETGEIYDDINQILDDQHILYHSLIISEFSYHAMWNSGNIPASELLMSDKKTNPKKNFN